MENLYKIKEKTLHMIIYLWLIVPVTLLVLMAFYLYRSIYKSIRYFRFFRKQKKVSVIATMILMLPIINVLSVWTVFLLHLAIISAIIDLMVFIIGKFLKRKNKILCTIYYSRMIAVLLAALILIYGYYNMNHVVKTEYTVTTEKTELSQNYKIALIADLHFGVSMDLKKLQSYANQIEGQHPDVVVLAGDIIDGNTNKDDVDDIFRILGNIDSTYGVYYVYGNHDAESFKKVPDKLKNIISENGITILNDSNEIINDELVLIGRANRAYGNKNTRLDITQLLEPVDLDKEIVLVDHQPCDYDKAEKAGVDLILSGHTHAGQIWPLGAVSNIFSFNDQNYGYTKTKQFNKIVTSGIAGWGYPIRTEEHSEYVMIQIERKHSN